MSSSLRRIIRPIIAVIIIAASSPAFAGTGSYKAGSPDVIELNVNFMYDESSPSDWEPLFKEASKLLFNATEGQMKIGKVVVYNNCSQATDKADIQIHDDMGGANAHSGSLGVPGRRIRLSQTHKTVTTSGAGNRGQFGLVHEMGHYVLALLDEYLDKNSKKVSTAYCIDKTSTTASVMDGGTTVSTKNRRHEFCWSQNHRAGETAQCSKRKIGSTTYEDTDSWTWLVAYVQDRYGASLTPPSADPVDSISGYGSDPEIVYRSCGLRAVVSIDRSGSMAALLALRSMDGIGPYAGTPLAISAAGLPPIDLAKQGAGTFLQLLEDTDKAAVTSFSSDATVDYAMNAMTAANKTAALAAISGLQASGLTNIGGGLDVSLQQITGDGAGIANEVIVLLSDGMHNTGTHPDAVLPAIKQRGVVVHTIGLGQADASLMSRIANETGGTYLFANSAAELNSHYLTILSAIRSEGVIESDEAELPAGESRNDAIYIDSYTSGAAAEFVLVWDDAAIETGLILRRPDDTTVVPSDPGVEIFYDAVRAFKRIRVSNPPAGNWTLQLTNPGSQATHYTLQVHSSATNVSLAADAGGDRIQYPDPLKIRAGVTVDQAVGGASLQATITRPQGPPITLTLHDDGEITHGDDLANDGLYSNLFRAFSGDGSYTIEVLADTEGGVTVQGGEEGGAFVSEPVARLVRRRSFSVVVEGMSSADGDLDGAPNAGEHTAPGSGDGNGDGIPDAVQADVASFSRATDGGKVTLVASGSGCAQLSGVTAGLPSPAPPNLDFPYGTFGFVLECSAGQAQLIFHGVGLNGRVYRYGPTADEPVPHWYDFTFDGATGAQIVGNRVTLHLLDGQRGDDDLVVNGVIVVDQTGVVADQHLPSNIPALSHVALLLLIAGMGILALYKLRF